MANREPPGGGGSPGPGDPAPRPPHLLRGRFAPTPSGPLHLGNARTALLAWLSARAEGGTLVMRIEDADRPRVRAGLEARLLEELRWLGLDWDEGPDLGGPCGSYRQSERLPRYAAALARLQAAGLAYPCFCSRAEAAAAARAPHGPGDDGPRYPGTCRGLDEAARTGRDRLRAPAWRLRVPEGRVAFVDRVHGPQEVEVAAQVGDFVLQRADGVPAYQLAVVVDDVEMGITEVVRGDDLLSSTGRQLLIWRALGAEPPTFGHVPLVMGEDGERLAKRHAALSLGELRERGADPRAIVGLLAALSGLAPRGARLAPCDLLPGFRLGAIPRTPALLRATDVEALAG